MGIADSQEDILVRVNMLMHGLLSDATVRKKVSDSIRNLKNRV